MIKRQLTWLTKHQQDVAATADDPHQFALLVREERNKEETLTKLIKIRFIVTIIFLV